ncbi:MAG: putative ABC transporter permease [Oscillospiraceae bacterium]
MLVPYSWFQILWYFYIYGFLGWCSEVAFAAIAHGKFVNRGFVNGPICSIYGFGVMSVLLVLGPLKSSLWLLFGGSVLFTSVIEYLTGWVLEKVFHDKWWDYSKRPLNIKGYVSGVLGAVGIACVFVVDVFQPLVAKVVDSSRKLGWALLGTFSALWIADNIITAMEIRKLPKKLHALQAIEDSLTAISDEIGEEIYIRASDAKDRGMEVYTDAKEKGAQIAEKRAENSLMRRSELLARRSELLQRREELLGQRNIVHERIAQAFPALREGKTNGPAFTRVHEHAQRRKQLAKALKAKARELKNKAKDRS